METGLIALVVIVCIISIMAGIRIEKERNSRQASQGLLNVDYSDPEDGPYLFLELKVPIEDVVNRERVIFDVVTKQYISHE